MPVNRKKKAKVFLVCVLCLINLLISSITVDAIEEDEHERGNLRINSHVISDTREEIIQHASIGFEVAPFLFLDQMTEMEALRVQTHQVRLDHARRIVFTTDHVDDRLNTSDIVAMLFQETEELSGTRQFETTYALYFEMPIWLWVIASIVLAILLGYIGMLVGQKVSHLIHKHEILAKEGDVK
ncbi:MAG: hypothetical protein FWG67_01485 [Defluviitaleaceae bacterium]|nr:hypothetical protein [Defluviitaleaceae bacterium]